MSPKTLKEFKQEIAKFSKLYDKLVTHWNGELVHGNDATFPVTIIVQVLVHNIAFDASDCAGYSHEKAVMKVVENIEMLKEINIYEDKTYMVDYAYKTISCLWDGMFFSEDY